MGATSGAGTAYPKEACEFTPGFCEIHVAQSSFLRSVLWIIICPFFFVIIWSAFRLTASE
jgi:hypothetical protein